MTTADNGATGRPEPLATGKGEREALRARLCRVVAERDALQAENAALRAALAGIMASANGSGPRRNYHVTVPDAAIAAARAALAARSGDAAERRGGT